MVCTKQWQLTPNHVWSLAAFLEAAWIHEELLSRYFGAVLLCRCFVQWDSIYFPWWPGLLFSQAKTTPSSSTSSATKILQTLHRYEVSCVFSLLHYLWSCSKISVWLISVPFNATLRLLHGFFFFLSSKVFSLGSHLLCCPCTSCASRQEEVARGWDSAGVTFLSSLFSPCNFLFF